MEYIGPNVHFTFYPWCREHYNAIATIKRIQCIAYSNNFPYKNMSWYHVMRSLWFHFHAISVKDFFFFWRLSFVPFSCILQHFETWTLSICALLHIISKSSSLKKENRTNLMKVVWNTTRERVIREQSLRMCQVWCLTWLADFAQC